ncbi:GNAT family N-acetyltransferase [Virgibacillus sp. NKC19-3]|uniref:GNAT family N-acetyltransferase n=1 Tax=Virgibacillus saliphilus TaxID=2831674 RepID=UPI001C9AF80A|nr:GNAT family N-acetyltransferase [Virgibacillus sp. NKC19-3]MBY7142963.1 GNAT family N-acetyltransferase [Virgibacillus sp. NKC19-3]
MKRIRKAVDADMDAIYAMGYDVWGDDLPMEKYINSCRSSTKYKKGTWYVYEDTQTGSKLSSLIVYHLDPIEGLIVRGIGSISTPVHCRNNGYASALIKMVLQALKEKEQCNHFFLYSDIGSAFYERLHFKVLPLSKQKSKDSVCMYYSELYDGDAISFDIPDYF